MRIVDRPVFKPLRCAAIPHVGQTDDVRWIDTGSEMPGFDNHVYLSSKAVEAAAKLLSMPTRREYDELSDELSAALLHNEELLERVTQLQVYADAYLAAFVEARQPDPVTP